MRGFRGLTGGARSTFQRQANRQLRQLSGQTGSSGG